MSRAFPHTLFVLIGATTVGLCAAPQKAQRGLSYNREIRPILSQNCFRCHGPDANARKANLRLDTEQESRRAIVPGVPARSRAYLRITDPNAARRMPPTDSHLVLKPEEIALIRAWILQGAPYERHWAFIAPSRPHVPASPGANSGRPLDAFVEDQLRKGGLAFSPEAPREKLLRRVTMDITGIPPSLEELDDFVADSSAGAYERVVDRLLASPRFGERWAWEWLEAARYSDTNGYQEDRTRTMWPWRDWVIAALNEDMPFDQFTREQIAGDLLPNATLSQKIATGFNRNHMLNGEGGRIPEESRVEYVVDRVDTTSTVWLGLTMACARCHDHKYDPFTQREYYQLYAYFNNVPESGSVDRSHSANPVIPLPGKDQTTQIEALQRTLAGERSKLSALEEKLRAIQPEWETRLGVDGAKLPDTIATIVKTPADKRTDQQKKDLTAHYLSSVPEREEQKKQVDSAQKALNDANNAVPLAMVMEERKEPRDTFILQRGAYDKFGDKVSAGTPSVLPSLFVGSPSNRLALADWLVDLRNPLTARVTVNRVWQQLFGTGLVQTSEDFGIQGETPSHPELLDWLAVEFMRPSIPATSPGTPWSLKRLIKLIVMSRTYRQESRTSRALLERDPQNRLLARSPRFRWPSHVIRDQALALSGLLVEKIGGPSVKPYQPDGVWEDFSYGKINYVKDQGENLYRRSLYTFWRRSVAPPAMFDTAARRVCVVRTERTNTPLQALNLMNDVQYVEAARVFAVKVILKASSADDRIKLMFRAATSRLPSSQELSILKSGFNRNLTRFTSDRQAAERLLAVGDAPRPSTGNPAEIAAYTTVASTILNLDETLTRE